MFKPEYSSLDTAAAQKVLQDIGSEVEWPYIGPDDSPFTIKTSLPSDQTKVMSMKLPFYDDYNFCALVDARAPTGKNTRYVLHKPGDVSLMNWTNEPIYSVNERAPIKLDRKTTVNYAKFFFHFVRGNRGRFIIVEKPEEVIWLPNANDKEKAEVNQRLIPVTYRGIGRDNLYTLSATVVFKNALFSTDIKIAPYEMDVMDTETNQPEHFTIGQMKLVNEELLLEDLNVPIDPPPTEFG